MSLQLSHGCSLSLEHPLDKQRDSLNLLAAGCAELENNLGRNFFAAYEWQSTALNFKKVDA